MLRWIFWIAYRAGYIKWQKDIKRDQGYKERSGTMEQRRKRNIQRERFFVYIEMPLAYVISVSMVTSEKWLQINWNSNEYIFLVWKCYLYFDEC